METHYSKLRIESLCKELQTDYPNWPFPLLFQGEEITRDIFFLDSAIEYNVIKLGENEIRDSWLIHHPDITDLNWWFHYQFFNGINHIVRSSESVALLPRLYRLKSALLESIVDTSLAQYFQGHFEMQETDKFIETLVAAVSRLIEICSQHDLVIWGMLIDQSSLKEQSERLHKIKEIRTDLVFELPHFKWFIDECRVVLTAEIKKYRQSEARFNKFKK